MMRSKGLPPDVGHSIPLGKSQRKSRLKTISHTPIAGTDYSLFVFCFYIVVLG